MTSMKTIALLLLSCLCLLIQPSHANVVINEIYYSAFEDCRDSEFVELYNAGGEPADISGWFLAGGVRFTFPAGTILPGGGYATVVLDRDVFSDSFRNAPRPLGEFEGRLDNQGEALALLNAQGEPVEAVAFSDQHPWPALADGLGSSIERIHPSFPADEAASWRASDGGGSLLQPLPQFRFDVTESSATPGRVNTAYQVSPPPRVDQVSHSPRSPASGDAVTIRARVRGEGVEQVTLLYQPVEAGQYVALNDEAYETVWFLIDMNREGDIWTADVPALPHRTLVRYRISASGAAGETMAPPAFEVTPNFAYFVYDGVPPYRVTEPVERVHDNLDDVPIYHLIASRRDIRNCETISLTDRADRREFRWFGTFVYNGTVYDHIRYRLRGGVWRYSFNKRMWKMRMNKGHYFQGHFNDGTPYPELRNTINLNAITQNMRINDPNRGELGLFETAGFWLFRKAGLLSPHTTWVHYRIIDEADEEGNDQFSGDFYGLFLDLEQPDVRYLRVHGYDEDSNLYKMNRGWTVDGKTWEKETNNCDPADDADIETFYRGYNRGGLDYLETHLDIDKYLSYRAIVEAIHHYDIYAEKNYYYIKNAATGLWEVVPWDIDIIFGSDHGSGKEPFRDWIVGDFGRPGADPDRPYTVAYQNRLRDILQRLYNEEVLFPILDEWRDLIADMAAADLNRWDLFQPPDAEASKSRYKSLDYRLNEMKDWIRQRIHTSYTDNNNGPRNYVMAMMEMAEDPDCPETPSVLAPETAPASSQRARFASSGFNDPNGDPHLASQWILTREDGLEIEPDFDSGESQRNRESISIDLSAFAPGAYRLRVRHKDISGRWSWWSEPYRIVIEEPVSVLNWPLY